MGKIGWVCLFLLSLFIKAQAQSLGEITKRIEPYDSEIAHLVDSFYAEYQSAEEIATQFDNLLAAWSFFYAHSELGFRLDYDLMIPHEDIRIVEQELREKLEILKEQGISEHQVVDYTLTQAMHPFHQKVPCDKPEFTKLHGAELTPVQLSIFHLKQNICEFDVESKHPGHLQSLLEARNPLGNSPEERALRARIDRRLSSALYRRNSLDSALTEYKTTEAILNSFAKSYQYVPSYGFISVIGLKSPNQMNQGLILSRKGSMLAAAQCFENAMTLYEKRRRISGVLWGQQRLMSAFFSVGDSEGAWKEFYALLDRAKEIERQTHSTQCHTIVGILGNIDYTEKKEHVHSLDTVLAEAWKRSQALDPSKRPVVKWERKVARHFDYVLSRALISQMANDVAVSQNFLTQAEADYTKLTTEKHDDAKLGKALIERSTPMILAWRAATNAGLGNTAPSRQEWKKALEALEQLSASLQSSVSRKMAEVMRAHALPKYELDVQLRLKEEYDQIRDNTGLRNTYESLARVYESLGHFEKSVKYLKLYEELREETQRLDQYTRLAKLDQQLEVSETKRQKVELEKENQELEARRWRLRILSASLAAIFLLSVVLFYLNRQRVINQRKRVEAENQLLERDLELKDAEMKRTTHELLRSNQSFSQLMNDMEKLTTNLSAENRKTARSLLIDHKAKTQEDIWRQFNLQFQNHYADFYQKLNDRNPDLTQTEQRICAMHLSGLESKEISAITGQTLNSIYALKSKLRKKIGVENDEILTETLVKLAEG